MNEQAAMMNQQQQQLMNMNQSLLSMNQMNPQQPQPQVTNFNRFKPFIHPRVISKQTDFINYRPQMVPRNRSYGMWGQQQFQNPNLNSGAMKPPPAFNKSLGPRSNWKGKRVNKPIDKRRMEQQQSLVSSGTMSGVNVMGGGSGVGISGGNLHFRNYNPPTLNELQHQNRLKARKFFPKKKFNKNVNVNMNMNTNTNTAGNGGRSAPYAPRNTTSFLIRAKKSGGIAPLVSPYPVTPSVLPTPILSPTTEVLGDMAKEEWGVDGYGSMKGLIRLRPHWHEMEVNDDEEEDEGGSSESDVEEHVEVERRLDHDLSRFEMIYEPNSVNAGGMDYHNVLENRVDDQDTHIAQLEEENLILKERLFLMERELGDLRRRMLSLERRGGRVDDANEEVLENESENESESHGEDTHSTGENNEEFTGENNQEDRCENGKNVGFADGFEGEAAETTEKFYVDGKLPNEDEGINVADTYNDNKSADVEREGKLQNEDEGINIADKQNDDINESGEANKSADVGAEVETAENVDDESDKHVAETDICMLEGEVTKEEKLG